VTTTRPAPQQPPATSKRRRAACLVPPRPPSEDEKYAYIQRNLPYLTTSLVIGAGCLIISQLRFEAHNPALWPFVIFTAIYIVYQVISLPVNFAGRGFDLAGHETRIRAWRPTGYPSVDIYLPICGEPAEVLRNTWNAVSELIARYQGVALAHVLDDGPTD
jgi:cellulose synthase (UDP-forming)